MTDSLNEGQTFAADYSLLHRIVEDDRIDCWLAVQNDTNERVFIKVLKQPLDAEKRNLITRTIEKQRGLVHTQIARTYQFGDFDGHDYLISQHVRSNHDGSSHFDYNGSFNSLWPVLSQVADVLIYTHSLGFAHGHLFPDNILIDADGKPHLGDFGLGLTGNDQLSVYLSPQIKTGHPADATDDIYSLGQLIFKSLTGKLWQDDQKFETNSPVPEDIRQLVTSMLQDSPYDRPNDLSNIVKILDAYVTGVNNEIDIIPTDFNRVQPSEPVEKTATTSHQLPRDRHTVSTPVAVAGLISLVVIAIIVFLFLPTAEPIVITTEEHAVPQSTRPQQAPRGEASKEPLVTPLADAKLLQLKEEGKETARTLLQLQIEVEEVGGQIWASAKYNEAVQLGLSGDDAYRNDEFQLAMDRYLNGISLLDEVLGSLESVFSDNETKGEIALQQGDAETALSSYSILNAIRAGDPDIEASLRRAENLEEVISLVDDGKVFEQNGDLESALKNYTSAFKLDSLWFPAAEAIASVNRKIANQAFNDKMSIAFANLADKNYDIARQAFLDAQRILPNSDEPRDGLQQIEVSEVQDQISDLRESSSVFTQDEKWKDAANAYSAILKLSPGTSFAVEGLALADSRFELEKELLMYIAQPGVMISDDVLNEAKTVVVAASRIKEPGPKLLDQISRLSHLISLARIPINVELKSDNKTDVTIYKIRNFGRLSSTRLALYPGTYTIVGKRRGYRDVREEVVLRGGHTAPTIQISCVEKI